MPRYDVTCCRVTTTTVTLEVEADSPEAAEEIVEAVLANNGDAFDWQVKEADMPSVVYVQEVK